MKTPEEMADYIERQAIQCVSLLAMNDGEYFAAKKAYKAGYQAAAPQWISVKDRLPEIGEWVLINGPEVCQRVAPPSSSWDWEFAWATDHQSFYEPTDITHWMLLPKPPEDE